MRPFDAGRFIVGANLPWIGYGTDVGASAWYPDGGLSAQPAAADRLDAALSTLTRDGISVVRVFLLCDARSAVRFDADGSPAGLDEAVFPDVDALVASARRHGVGLLPVLLDFHLCGRAETVDGVQLRGRSRLVVEPGPRAALFDCVLRPLIERYGQDETIVAWDVMNEPEWCLGAVRFGVLQEFLGEAVQCVRQAARQPVTIGCAGTWQLDLVAPLGLDIYQVHWYERFGWRALSTPVSALGLGDRPVILGEFPGRGIAVDDVLRAAKDAGYAGAFVWSALSDDEQSAYPADLATWIAAH